MSHTPLATALRVGFAGLLCGASAAVASQRALPPSTFSPVLLDPPSVAGIDRGVPLRLSDEDPRLSRIDRDDIDAVMRSVGDIGWVDGNLQLGFDPALGAGRLDDDDYTSLVGERMGIGLAITSISDCLRVPARRRCAQESDELEGLTRYGLDPQPEYDGRDRLSSRRDRYVRATTTTLIQSSLDMDPAAQAGRLGVLLYAQKHFPMRGSPFSPIAHQRAGLAVFQTVYGGPSEAFNGGPGERLAFGVYERSTLGDADGDGVRDAVTPLGARTLQVLAQRGLAIDLSHASDDAVLQSVRAVPADVPVMANHTLAQDLPGHRGDARSRGLNDEAILAIARQGGVIGLMPLKYFLIGKDGSCGPDPDHPESLTSELVRHVNYVVDLIDSDAASGLRGAEHVGLSSDTYVSGRPGHPWWSACELDAPERWRRVLRRLAEERRQDGSYRYSVHDLRDIAGLNFRRVLRHALPGFSPPGAPRLRRLAAPLVHELDWDDVKVTSSPSVPDLRFSEEDVRYRVVIEGKYAHPRDPRYRTLLERFTTASQLRIPQPELPDSGYSHWRVTVRAYDVRDPARYVDSVFYHLDP